MGIPMWSLTVVESDMGWTVATDELAEKPWAIKVISQPQHLIDMFQHLGFQTECHPIEVMNLNSQVSPQMWEIDYDSENPNAIRMILER